jgi:hypothetical protein
LVGRSRVLDEAQTVESKQTHLAADPQRPVRSLGKSDHIARGTVRSRPAPVIQLVQREIGLQRPSWAAQKQSRQAQTQKAQTRIPRRGKALYLLPGDATHIPTKEDGARGRQFSKDPGEGERDLRRARCPKESCGNGQECCTNIVI